MMVMSLMDYIPFCCLENVWSLYMFLCLSLDILDGDIGIDVGSYISTFYDDLGIDLGDLFV